MNARIRKVNLADAPRIREIYNYYISHSLTTFETVPISVEEVVRRIKKYSARYPWYVAEIGAMVVGYAYASEFVDRPAYAHTSETTIFIDKEYTGAGCGRALYARLLEEMKKLNFAALISIIAIPNPASVRLHTLFGFEKVGHLKKAGYKLNTWIDVEYWELLLPA